MPLFGAHGKLIANAPTAAALATALTNVTLTQTDSTADATLAADTVSTNIGAFTDPPSAAEMALLRTFVNALKADLRDLKSFANSIADALQAAGIVK